MDDAGKVCGWCSELYDAPTKERLPKELLGGANATRYLVGAMAPENNGYSILMFKLSNVRQQAPLLYEIHDAYPEDCSWSAMSLIGGFFSQGRAKIELEELPYSEEKANQIKERFDEVDLAVNNNLDLVHEVAEWKQKPITIWTK